MTKSPAAQLLEGGLPLLALAVVDLYRDMNAAEDDELRIWIDGLTEEESDRLRGSADHIPTAEERAATCERLGIDVPKWAAEVRAKVAAYAEPKPRQRFTAPAPLPVGRRVRVLVMITEPLREHHVGALLLVLDDENEPSALPEAYIWNKPRENFYTAGSSGGEYVSAIRSVELVEEESELRTADKQCANKALGEQLQAFTTINANLRHATDQHREARDALNWIHERLCETQDRLEFEQRDHEVTKGYRQHRESELAAERAANAELRRRISALEGTGDV